MKDIKRRSTYVLCSENDLRLGSSMGLTELCSMLERALNAGSIEDIEQIEHALQVLLADVNVGWRTVGTDTDAHERTVSHADYLKLRHQYVHIRSCGTACVAETIDV